MVPDVRTHAVLESMQGGPDEAVEAVTRRGLDP
jgi:hypothetical protein